jgi:hypothetical protein
MNESKPSLQDELRAIALKVVDDWHAARRNPETEAAMLARFEQAVKKRVEARIADHLEELVSAEIGAAVEEQALQIANKLIDKWAKNGEIAFDEPTPKIKAALESALCEYEGRHQIFLHAARQRKIEALALHEAGVPLVQIAKEAGVIKRTAMAWIEDEKKELEDLKKTLAIYGYVAAKAE